MKQTTTISIPKPCNENWNSMTNTQSGRFCGNCAKTVIDFTAMSDEQMIAYLSKSGNICGRFSNTQVSSFNLSVQAKVSSMWKRLALAASLLLCSFPFYNAEAKGKPVATWQPIVLNNNTELLPADTIGYITITGKVIADGDGSTLPGINLVVSGTNLKTQTNANGKFKLVVPDTVRQIQVSFVGFESTKIDVKPKKKGKYKFR